MNGSPAPGTPTSAPRGWPLSRALRLRCPRCGEGRLFRGWFAMQPSCTACGLDLEREPGFYLGSIYVNYGVTALATIVLYGVLVLLLGWSAERALAACLAAAVILPMWLFRYARALLLAIDTSVNRESAARPAGETGLSAADLATFVANDGQAGCAMGIAMTLVLLFGLLMAGVTLMFAIGPGTDAEGTDTADAPAPMEPPATGE